MAVRNLRVHEFFPESLVSQTRIELQRMRLGVQQEIVDVPEISGRFNSGDQQRANTKTSFLPAHRHATDLGRRTIILQHNTGGPHRLAVSQRHKMQGFAVMLIALQIDGNALFDDEDLFSDPKTRFDVLRRTGRFDGYHSGPGARERFE